MHVENTLKKNTDIVHGPVIEEQLSRKNIATEYGM